VSGNVDAQMTILWEMPKIYLPQILLVLKCRMLYVYLTWRHISALFSESETTTNWNWEEIRDDAGRWGARFSFHTTPFLFHTTPFSFNAIRILFRATLCWLFSIFIIFIRSVFCWWLSIFSIIGSSLFIATWLLWR